MKRQNDNSSSGAVTGGNKSLAVTREVNLDALSSDNSEEKIREVIPVPDSPREGRSYSYRRLNSRGYQKGHGVLISAAPSLWNKVICRYPGFTFQTFV